MFKKYYAVLDKDNVFYCKVYAKNIKNLAMFYTCFLTKHPMKSIET